MAADFEEPQDLIRTILAPGKETALQAWERWVTEHDLDGVSSQSLSLLHAAYERWKEDVEFVFDQRITGIARKEFYLYSLQRGVLRQCTETLNANNISFRFVGDTLSHVFFQTLIPFAGSHVALWVAREDVVKVLRLLLQARWSLQYHTRLAATLRHASGTELQLSWSLSRHWDVSRHRRYWEDIVRPDMARMNYLIGILLLTMPEGKFGAPGSLIRFATIARLLSPEERTAFIDACKYYLISDRMRVALQSCAQYDPIFNTFVFPEGELHEATLDDAFHRWIHGRAFFDKLRYHRLRFKQLHTGGSRTPVAFVAYCIRQRAQSKQLIKWITATFQQQH